MLDLGQAWFMWMMYRCGWGTKSGQETALAVEITRDGFEWALRHACLSSYVRGVHPDPATWQRQLKHAHARRQRRPRLGGPPTATGAALPCRRRTADPPASV